MHYSNEILIGVLTVISGVFIGLYMAKRKHYNELVQSNRLDEERRWTDEQIGQLWKHISELENGNSSSKSSPSKKHISF